MTQFTLEVQIDSKGLDTLQAAGQKVAIVKETTPSAHPVIWVAFPPEKNNTVTWTEIYDVYASTTSIQNGATIVTDSMLQASDQSQYPFSGGQFHAGSSTLGPNQYGIKNADPDPQFALLTAGLAQAPGGTGGNGHLTPLNATVVPYNDHGTYTPIEKVSVFAEAQANNGLVISEVQTDALLVDLTVNPTQVIHYDSTNNQFAMGPLP